MKNEAIVGDCADVLKTFPDESIDCIVTDPPYGYSFMGLQWDKALPSIEALQECCRVLKAGAFGFFMCAPRQDVLSRMIIRLEDAGFNVNFSSIFWAQAQGFPKSQNISKAIDRRFGAERKATGKNPCYRPNSNGVYNDIYENPQRADEYITSPATPEAQEFQGSYAGMQLKPCLEIIITVMKPLECKTYIDQALANGKGVSWLGNCKIPYENESEVWQAKNKIIDNSISSGKMGILSNEGRYETNGNADGRFPANLLVSDNVLDRGIITKSKAGIRHNNSVLGINTKDDTTTLGLGDAYSGCSDSGDFSRYFSLDAWFEKKLQELPPEQQKTFPFLITPKPSKSEKNKYIENKHPTVKPLKLMSYLITMGSREGDVILDPFAGSGTTLEACRLLNRVFIGIDKDPENEKYMRARGQLDEITLETFQEAET